MHGRHSCIPSIYNIQTNFGWFSLLHALLTTVSIIHTLQTHHWLRICFHWMLSICGESQIQLVLLWWQYSYPQRIKNSRIGEDHKINQFSNAIIGKFKGESTRGPRPQQAKNGKSLWRWCKLCSKQTAYISPIAETSWGEKFFFAPGFG